MADTLIADLVTITGAQIDPADLVTVVDVSDTTLDAQGSTKQATVAAAHTTLYDKSSGAASLIADNDALTIQSDIDFVSHGKLDLTGFSVNGTPIPTWFDPAEAAWDDGGWFAFGYVAGGVAQHIGFGPDEVVRVGWDGIWINHSINMVGDNTNSFVFYGDFDDVPGSFQGNFFAGPLTAVTPDDTKAMSVAGADVLVLAGGSGIGVATVANGAAPSDAQIDAVRDFWGGRVIIPWVNQAANKLMFKVVYSDGTTHKSGEIALT
jgi:hypothetical protein